MIVLESSPPSDGILDFVDQSVAQLAEAELEANSLLVGQNSYPRLCTEISVRFVRGKGEFETYNHIPIVVDPFRDEEVCVVAGPAATSIARGYKVPPE